MQQYILTLSCQDRRGIVAAVTGFLAEHSGFIIESAQYGDSSTGQFFMRTLFRADAAMPKYDQLKDYFAPIAASFGMKWEIRDTTERTRLLLMVSKQSHCLTHLLHKASAGILPVEIAAVVSNHADLAHIAQWYNIPFHHLPITSDTKPQQEAQLKGLVESLAIDLVVLARYMQILSPDLCDYLKERAINIHHSFLPSFKGAKPYHQAYDRGVKIIGATAHYVTTDLDEGPIIEQEVVHVNHTHTPEALVALGQDIESRVLTRAVQHYVEHRILLNDHKTVVFSQL